MNPVAMVFAVILAIVIAAAGVYEGLSLLNSGSSNAVSTDVFTIMGNAQSSFGEQGDYAGISSDSATVIPKSLQVNTPVGGTFAVASGSAGLPNNEFAVEMNGLTLNQKSCAKTVAGVADISTEVNGTAVGNSNGSPTGAQAAAACSGGASSIEFVFGNNT
ncbi:MAG: type 4 pilus major pilin [Acidithiobacillus sp.]|nr:type 4 pilus major pilin [Acidithiobacillus sp.]